MIKYSRQREEILAAVRANKIHPTANEVYDIVKRTNPTMSLATVYRNLNLLASLGELKKICVPNASDRFDGTTHEHYHMVYTNCGKVCDVDYDLENLSDEVKSQIGATLTEFHLIMYGICEACKEI